MHIHCTADQRDTTIFIILTSELRSTNIGYRFRPAVVRFGALSRPLEKFLTPVTRFVVSRSFEFYGGRLEACRL